MKNSKYLKKFSNDHDIPKPLRKTTGMEGFLVQKKKKLGRFETSVPKETEEEFSNDINILKLKN